MRKAEKLIVIKRNIWVGLFTWLMVSACGYGFMGSGNLPSGIQSVSVAILENRTFETGLENIFTNDIIQEFNRNGNMVFPDREKADAVLSGVIKAARIKTISRKGPHLPLRRRVYVKVDLKLTSKDGRIIWSAKEISDAEPYNVEVDKRSTEINRKFAFRVISKRFAENMYNRLRDDF